MDRPIFPCFAETCNRFYLETAFQFFRVRRQKFYLRLPKSRFLVMLLYSKKKASPTNAPEAAQGLFRENKNAVIFFY